MPSSAPQTTIEIAPLAREASFAPASVNPETRTVDLTFSTGAPVRRFDAYEGVYYTEKLSMKPEHIRMDRLNAGAPLLDSHSSRSLSSQIGVVESASITGKKGLAKVRFSERAEVEPIFRDVVSGIIRNVSVGYAVHVFEEARKGDQITRTAIDWEPYEISMVSMPADVGAQVRDGKPAGVTNPCQIIVRGDSPADFPTEESAMPDVDRQPETIVERNPLDPGAPMTPAVAPASVPEAVNDRDLGVSAERERVNGIRAACVAARIPRDIEQRLIDSGKPLVQAQADVLEELRRRGYDQEGPANVSVRDRSQDGDPHVHQTEGIKEAILHRLAPNSFPMTDKGRAYRGMSMMDIAKVHLQARGVRTTDMTQNQIAGAALGITHRGGYHTTSDFPLLLADVASKSLRKAYDEAPQTFKAFASRITLANYRTTSMMQLGDAPALLEVLEHGEYTSGTTGEAREQVRLRKYGRKFAITREAMINDDLDAFSRVPQNFGRKARALESDIVWEQITSNPTMGDGNPLFSIAHGNVASPDGAIAIGTLGAARSALRTQTSVDGEYLNLEAKFLLVPPGLETLADQYVTVVTPTANSSVNPFAGKLGVVSDPRLSNAYEWYVATGPEFQWLVYGYLEGEEGPQVENRNGFDIDGLEIKCRLDFMAKDIDWRGIYKNEGAT